MTDALNRARYQLSVLYADVLCLQHVLTQPCHARRNAERIRLATERVELMLKVLRVAEADAQREVAP